FKQFISYMIIRIVLFFFQAEDGIRDFHVTGVQTCALPIFEFFTRGRRIRRDRQSGSLDGGSRMMRLGVRRKSRGAEHQQQGSPAQGSTSEITDFTTYSDEPSMGSRSRKRYPSY